MNNTEKQTDTLELWQDSWNVMGELRSERLEPIHKLRVEVLIFFPNQPEMNPDCPLADCHEFE